MSTEQFVEVNETERTFSCPRDVSFAICPVSRSFFPKIVFSISVWNVFSLLLGIFQSVMATYRLRRFS